MSSRTLARAMIVAATAALALTVGTSAHASWSDWGFNSYEDCMSATNDWADCNDGSEPDPTITYGCTDPVAANYNPAANTNDGSCQYSPPAPVDGGGQYAGLRLCDVGGVMVICTSQGIPGSSKLAAAAKTKKQAPTPPDCWAENLGLTYDAVPASLGLITGEATIGCKNGTPPYSIKYTACINRDTPGGGLAPASCETETAITNDTIQIAITHLCDWTSIDTAWTLSVTGFGIDFEGESSDSFAANSVPLPILAYKNFGIGCY